MWKQILESRTSQRARTLGCSASGVTGMEGSCAGRWGAGEEEMGEVFLRYSLSTEVQMRGLPCPYLLNCAPVNPPLTIQNQRGLLLFFKNQ